MIISKQQGFSLGAVLSQALGVTSSDFTMRARSVAAQGSYTSTTNQTTTTTTSESSKDGCLVALTTAAEQG